MQSDNQNETMYVPGPHSGLKFQGQRRISITTQTHMDIVWGGGGCGGCGKLHPTFQGLLAKEASLFHSLILINIVDHIT